MRAAFPLLLALLVAAPPAAAFSWADLWSALESRLPVIDAPPAPSAAWSAVPVLRPLATGGDQPALLVVRAPWWELESKGLLAWELASAPADPAQVRAWAMPQALSEQLLGASPRPLLSVVLDDAEAAQPGGLAATEASALAALGALAAQGIVDADRFLLREGAPA